jgi:thioesterase domain-containing protein/acyl carrier protein
LLDAALRADAASLVPLRLDTAALGPQAGPLLSGLVRPAGRRIAAAEAAGPATVQRLRGLDEAARRNAVLDLVREAVAGVLGHPSAAAIEPDQPFLEVGLDSLTSVELRNALATATGLSLPATVVFYHATPVDLAEHLHSQFGAPQNAPAGETDADETVGRLFRRAGAEGRLHAGFEMLQSVARLRETFAGVDDVRRPPAAVRLTKGTRPVRLICFSSYVALAGVHQYARFASEFRGVRDVVALSVPGFASGEQLPATEDALLDVLARTVREQAGDEPFALLGSSSGGVLAYATAARLELQGQGPAGVVLLDTYVPGDDSLDQFGDQLLGGMFEREATFARMDAARLSAMSWYFNLLGEWRPAPLTAPVLLVRAGEPMARAGELTAEQWQTGWSAADETVDVSGNHFTMMEDLAGVTARTVDAWVDRLPAGGK